MEFGIFAGTCPEHPDSLCVSLRQSQHDTISHEDIAESGEEGATDWLRSQALLFGRVVIESTIPLVYRVETGT